MNIAIVTSVYKKLKSGGKNKMSIDKKQKAELNTLIRQILELRDKVCLRCKSTQTLQASHIYPKGRYKKLEFDTDNIKFLCWSCHWWWHKNPIEARDWLYATLPKARLDRIKMRSQTTGDGMRNYKLLKIMLEQDIKKLTK